MATIKELEEQKRVLEAQEKLRMEKYEQKQKVKGLKRDIRQLKYGHITRGISNTGRVLGSGFKSMGTQLKPLGKQVVSYGQYLAGPEKSPVKSRGKFKTIYIKKGKHYVKKKVRREYKPNEQKQQSGYQSSSSLSPSVNWGW